MKAICVEDEALVLELVVSLLSDMPRITQVQGFDHAADALAYLSEQPADIAVLDIDMPDMNGIELAMRIREVRPDTAILFLTGYSQFALDAYAAHPAGYLLKPVNREKLAAEVTYALDGRKVRAGGHIEARTFGEFDLFVDEAQVSFSRAKAKEVLAYLLDRRGGSVTRAAVFAALWEDRPYDRQMQKYLDVILRSLRETLASYGISEILEVGRGTLRIRPETIDCDAWRFFDGDPAAINSYRGEYMSAYVWASMNEALMDQKYR
ncbi:MAG: response regulator [Clostridia bacterium]|nr:response regulator [Clostridia bacterium]